MMSFDQSESIEVTNKITKILKFGLRKRNILIQNNGGCSIFVGNSKVTDLNGIKLTPGSSLSVKTRSAIYAITSYQCDSNIRVLTFTE